MRKYYRESEDADAVRRRQSLIFKNISKFQRGKILEKEIVLTVDDFSLAIPNLPQLNQFVEDGDIWESVDSSDW